MILYGSEVTEEIDEPKIFDVAKSPTPGLNHQVSSACYGDYGRNRARAVSSLPASAVLARSCCSTRASSVGGWGKEG
eukprot:1916518-Pyramimonas_sp.AAC.1